MKCCYNIRCLCSQIQVVAIQPSEENCVTQATEPVWVVHGDILWKYRDGYYTWGLGGGGTSREEEKPLGVIAAIPEKVDDPGPPDMYSEEDEQPGTEMDDDIMRSYEGWDVAADFETS